MALTLSSTYIRNNFSEVISRVSFGKEIIIIEKQGKQIAKITPVTNKKTKGVDLSDISLDLPTDWKEIEKQILDSKDPFQ